MYFLSIMIPHERPVRADGGVSPTRYRVFALSRPYPVEKIKFSTAPSLAPARLHRAARHHRAARSRGRLHRAACSGATVLVVHMLAVTALHRVACSPRPARSLLPPPPIWRATSASTEPPRASRRGGELRVKSSRRAPCIAVDLRAGVELHNDKPRFVQATR